MKGKTIQQMTGLKVGDIVNVAAGRSIFEPFTGEVVGFIDQWVVVECDGDPLEVSHYQIEKTTPNMHHGDQYARRQLFGW